MDSVVSAGVAADMGAIATMAADMVMEDMGATARRIMGAMGATARRVEIMEIMVDRKVEITTRKGEIMVVEIMVETMVRNTTIQLMGRDTATKPATFNNNPPSSMFRSQCTLRNQCQYMCQSQADFQALPRTVGQAREQAPTDGQDRSTLGTTAADTTA